LGARSLAMRSLSGVLPQEGGGQHNG